MKGLLIGLSYAIRKLFEMLASAMVIPFTLGWYSNSFPSCGMVYYVMSISMGLIAVLVCVCVLLGSTNSKRNNLVTHVAT